MEGDVLMPVSGEPTYRELEAEVQRLRRRVIGYTLAAFDARWDGATSGEERRTWYEAKQILEAAMEIE